MVNASLQGFRTVCQQQEGQCISIGGGGIGMADFLFDDEAHHNSPVGVVSCRERETGFH